MSVYYLSLVVLAVSASAIGQILFKITALRIAEAPDASLLPILPPFISHLLLDYYFWGALMFYGTATLGWIYVLQYVPLSRAYPFMALGYLLIPALSWFIFKEPLTLRYLYGISLIVAGIVIIGYDHIAISE